MYYLQIMHRPLHLAVIHQRVDVITWALAVMNAAAMNIDTTNKMSQVRTDVLLISNAI